jgi:hypothetical protein
VNFRQGQAVRKEGWSCLRGGGMSGMKFQLGDTLMGYESLLSGFVWVRPWLNGDASS